MLFLIEIRGEQTGESPHPSCGSPSSLLPSFQNFPLPSLLLGAPKPFAPYGAKVPKHLLLAPVLHSA